MAGIGNKYAALLTAAALVSSMHSFATAATADKNAPIKIGFITSLTGVAAGPGEDMANGIQLYMDEVKGKMAGHPVELVIENDGSSPAGAAAKLQKLSAEDHVDILDGVMLANIAYAVVPFAEKAEIPMVGAVATADDLTQREHFKWFVRTGYTSSQPMQPFGEYVYKKLGYKRIAVFAMDYKFGWEQVGGFQRSFEEAGGQVVQKLWAPLGFLDFKDQMKALRKDVDAVFLLSIGTAAAVVPKQYKEFGPGKPVIGSGSSYDEFVLGKLGDPAIGAVTPLIYSAALQTAANKTFASAYRAKYKKDPSYYAECAYTSGMWIDKALQSLHGDVSDKNKVLAALKSVELKDAPRGPMKLDEHANPIQNVYIRRVDKVNGKLQNTVITTIPNVSQFWKWNPDQYLKDPPYSKDYPPCTHCDK